jgi:thiol-disulfide isomerase/thioredoxin
LEVTLRLLILAGVGFAVAVTIIALRVYFARSRVPMQFDPKDASNGGGALLVEFTSPYCQECREAIPYLKAASLVHGARLEVIDARERPDLAQKYDIRHTPTILVVDRRGAVRGGWTGIPSSDELEAALVAAS